MGLNLRHHIQKPYETESKEALLFILSGKWGASLPHIRERPVFGDIGIGSFNYCNGNI